MAAHTERPEPELPEFPLLGVFTLLILVAMVPIAIVIAVPTTLALVIALATVIALGIGVVTLLARIIGPE